MSSTEYGYTWSILSLASWYVHGPHYLLLSYQYLQVPGTGNFLRVFSFRLVSFRFFAVSGAPRRSASVSILFTLGTWYIMTIDSFFSFRFLFASLPFSVQTKRKKTPPGFRTSGMIGWPAETWRGTCKRTTLSG